MDDTFAATAIARTQRTDSSVLEIALTDAAGRQTVIALPAEIVSQLAREMREFADSAKRSGGAAPTKRPKSFAVGTGRFEDVVLVRFEDDAPYALGAEVATDLGLALLEQSESVGLRPEKVLQ